MLSRCLTVLSLILSFVMLVAIGCSDDDEPTSSSKPQNTPEALVGTWEWAATTQDGVPVPSFEELSFTDTSTSQELQFMPGGFWETREYYNGLGPVYTRSGTCYDSDSLYITCTNDNGTPDDTEFEGTSWMVEGDILTLGKSLEIPVDPPQTLTILSTYNRMQ